MCIPNLNWGFQFNGKILFETFFFRDKQIKETSNSRFFFSKYLVTKRYFGSRSLDTITSLHPHKNIKFLKCPLNPIYHPKASKCCPFLILTFSDFICSYNFHCCRFRLFLSFVFRMLQMRALCISSLWVFFFKAQDRYIEKSE